MMLRTLVGCLLLRGGAAQTGADTLDLGDTVVSTAEKTREITGVSPTKGSSNGGTRIHVEGAGFATEFFAGSNAVYIGSDAEGWAPCDVVEGACTVDCGGDKKIVCDTGPWVADEDSGWLDVWVVVEDTISTYDIIKESAYAYKASTDADVPQLTGVEPRHLGAGDVLGLRGRALGAFVSDYRVIYVGAGRPPQGGNVVNGFDAARTTQALCRADDLNLAVNADTGNVDGASLPIMVEDAVIGHNSPVADGARIKSSTRLQCSRPRALRPCFENSWRAIDSSKSHPNRRRSGRARDFRSLTSRLTGRFAHRSPRTRSSATSATSPRAPTTRPSSSIRSSATATGG